MHVALDLYWVRRQHYEKLSRADRKYWISPKPPSKTNTGYRIALRFDNSFTKLDLRESIGHESVYSRLMDIEGEIKCRLHKSSCASTPIHYLYDRIAPSANDAYDLRNMSDKVVLHSSRLNNWTDIETDYMLFYHKHGISDEEIEYLLKKFAPHPLSAEGDYRTQAAISSRRQFVKNRCYAHNKYKLFLSAEKIEMIIVRVKSSPYITFKFVN